MINQQDLRPQINNRLIHTVTPSLHRCASPVCLRETTFECRPRGLLADSGAQTRPKTCFFRKMSFEAPGSSRQGLSGKKHDFGPQICKHLALKYANPDNAQVGPDVPEAAADQIPANFLLKGSSTKCLGHFTLVSALSISHHLKFCCFSNYRDAARNYRLQRS